MVLSKFKKDAIFTFSGQVVVMLCLFVINKIFSTYLSIDDFASYNIIRRSVMIISYVMLGGIGIALPRYIAIYKAQKSTEKIVTTILSSIIYVICNCIIVCLLIFIFKQFFGREITGDDSVNHLTIVVIFSISTTVGSFLIAYLRGNDDFIKYNVTCILAQIILLIPLIFITRLNIYDIYYCWALINFIFYGIIIARIVKRDHHSIQVYKWRSQFKSTVKEITTYSFPRLIGDLFLFFMPAFPLYYLNNYYSLTDVAYFSVGTSIVTMATPVFGVLGTILLPYIAKNIAQNNIHSTALKVKKLMFYYMGCALIIVSVFYIFMPLLIKIFFSTKYLASIGIGRILILSIITEALYLLYRNPLDAVSKIPYNTIIIGISLAILITSFYVVKDLQYLAIAYVGVSVFKGFCSYVVWACIVRNLKRQSINNNNPHD